MTMTRRKAPTAAEIIPAPEEPASPEIAAAERAAAEQAASEQAAAQQIAAQKAFAEQLAADDAAKIAAAAPPAIVMPDPDEEGLVTITMLTGMSGPAVCVTRGDSYRCDLAEAVRLVQAGHAAPGNPQA